MHFKEVSFERYGKKFIDLGRDRDYVDYGF